MYVRTDRLSSLGAFYVPSVLSHLSNYGLGFINVRIYARWDDQHHVATFRCRSSSLLMSHIALEDRPMHLPCSCILQKHLSKVSAHMVYRHVLLSILMWENGRDPSSKLGCRRPSYQRDRAGSAERAGYISFLSRKHNTITACAFASQKRSRRLQAHKDAFVWHLANL